MRKRYKNKKRTCALCKPYKRNWEMRWSKGDLVLEEKFIQEVKMIHI